MRAFLLYFFTLLTTVAYTQNDQIEHIRSEVEIGISSGSNGTLSFPLDEYTINKRIIGGNVLIKLDLGEDYVIGEGDQFTGQVTINIEARKDGAVVNILPVTTTTLTVNQDQPRSYFIIKLSDLTETINGNEDLRLDELIISVSDAILPAGYYGNIINLSASGEIDLGLDANGLTTNAVSVEVNNQAYVSAKRARFSWTDSHPVTNYELQVLRLYNISVVTASNEQEITTVLDWSKALTFQGKASIDETNNSKHMTLTLAEGTGYYVFRVRPLGSYYPNGVADQRNWGVWSASDPDGTTKNLNLNTVSLPYFFFADPDENRNWIYNRVFTEHSKIKENLTFANGLQQPRQSQTYLPSQDVTLVTQTILDYSGRPSVTTIPIPLSGRVSSYKESLVKNASGELYKAKDFDKDENYQNPAATTPFDYYDNNADKSIPNASGYGYTRTIYYNENSGRIKEQSGVGETHKIGGKTTRYLYATPTDDELVALFGDEAPDAESVLKTITVDPNDVASITYTSKEGNVIATSLAFYQQNVGNLIDLDEPVTTTTVTDKITENSKGAGGFISTKRISLTQDNPNFQVSYSIECIEFEQLCQVATLDCSYQLAVDLIKLGNNGEVVERQSLIDQALSKVICQDIGDKSYKIVNQELPIDLPAGNYIIQKRLSVGNASLAISDNEETISAQVYPLAKLIAGWLDNVENTDMLAGFNKSLYNLSQAIANQTLATFQNDAALQADFPVNFSDKFLNEVYAEFKDQYYLEFQPAGYNPYGANADENPAVFTLGTPCCIINIPIKWMPPFDCETMGLADADGSGDYNTVNYLQFFDPANTVEAEFLPDFEGYALAYLSECIGPDFANEQALKNIIYSVYMDGWEIEGTFNMMIHHMLNDQYNTVNTVDGTAESKVQYDCDELLGCWEAQLSRLKDEICVKFNFYEENGRQNVSSAYDDEYAGDSRDDKYDKDHNNHFDDNFKGGFFLTKWIAKRKVSRRMRRLQAGGTDEGEAAPEIGQFHLVKEFLGCTGYQFAKIITPFDAEPLAADNATGYNYRVNSGTTPVPFDINHSVNYAGYFGGNSFYDNGFSGLKKLLVNPGTYGYSYVPLNNWDPKKRIKNDEGDFVPGPESLFPNIKNPIYAFKYFEYVDQYFTDPEGIRRSIYQPMELEVCFSDPNDCYQMDANGFIVTDASGTPIKVPCCSANPAFNAEGCFADTEYPGLNSSMVGYGTDGLGNPAKYIVTEFCERGRIKCPYTKDAWSSGQRYTFYNMLKNYKVPTGSAWEQMADFNLTCEDLSNDHQWYVYTGDLDAQAANGYPDLANDVTIGSYPIEYYTQLSLADNTTTFKYIMLEIETQLKDCNNGCDRRRNEFKGRLIKMLMEKCYEIGGCRTDDPSTFNIIPEEDIDLMVDGLVEACKSQCNLTTYSCQTSPCRSVDKAFTDIGFDRNEFKLNYGMGGYDPAFCDATSYSYEDATKCADIGNGISECDILDEVTGKVNLLSWYEYTKLKQVQEWDFDVDMPTMCLDANGNPIATDNDLTCCGAGANSSAGDTFVPKSQYEVNTTTPPDSNNPAVGTQVKSPTVGVNVTVNPSGN